MTSTATNRFVTDAGMETDLIFHQFYNGHRPHQGITNTRPMHLSPVPALGPDKLTRLGSLDIRRCEHLGGVLHEYEHAA